MKLFILLLSTSVILFGCSDVEKVEEQEVIPKQDVVAEEKQPIVEESKEEVVETAKVEEVVVEPVNDNILLRAEVDSIFPLDQEETQYENGKLKLKNGDVLEVDYISYIGVNGIDYASALFFEDTLVKMQLDTTLSDEELENVLGIDINEDLIVDDKRDRGVFEITFDSKFGENEIAIYPFEF